MTQMVLPQTPAPGMQNDAGAPKTGSGRDSSAGESRYDSVSRAEQKRLDGQQSEPTRETAESGSGGKASAKDEGHVAVEEAVNEVGEKGAETAPEMEAIATPLTFAQLQALLLPATGQVAVAGDTTGLAASNPAMTPGTELFAGLTGGKPGQAAPSGLMAGLQLTTALSPAAGEKAGVMDPSSLLTGTRFESTMDLVSQQNANTAGKLATEAQVPLRSYATSVDVPVNHAEWGDKLMGKLSWLTAKNLSVAEIHLTPPDMGPMEVRVRVQNDQASITVHAANPVVRDQLELHSHRLRDMLGEQGLSLAQFDVSSNSQNQSGQQGAGEGEGSSSSPGTMLSALEGGGEEMQAGSLDLSWNGAVDIFA